MWNMQSGKERRSFHLSGTIAGDSRPKIIAQTKPKKKAIEAEKVIEAVTGLATDALNTRVIASTLEGKLYVSFLHLFFLDDKS
jgi:U3 small nucleolar RNA-associated protein 21